ncbi:MAG: DMT family transporter [Oscillospiraceae bacterium]|jgi:drug/metabolite transporter (DMT)-like permease
MDPKKKAILQMLACAALWSTAGIFIKLVPWNPFVIAGWRSLIAAIVGIVYMRTQKLSFVWSRHSRLGGLSLALTMLLFVTANKTTTAANAIVLQFTTPVFIVILSALLFRKKFRPADIVTVVLTLAGISLFFFDKLSAGHQLGNVIALSSGVTFAFYYISLGDSPEGERMSAILIADAMTFLVGLPFTFTTQPEIAPVPLLFMLLLGVVQLGIPYVLLAKAAEHCPPLACCLLGAVEPLLNPLWVFLLDGEAPGPRALAGGAVVILTVTLWSVWKAKHPETEAQIEQSVGT